MENKQCQTLGILARLESHGSNKTFILSKLCFMLFCNDGEYCGDISGNSYFLHSMDLVQFFLGKQ